MPEDLNWRTFAGAGVDIVRLPGDHGQILAEPNLSFMTRKIGELLAPAEVLSELEEFELDEDGLINLSAEVPCAPHARAHQLSPVWMRETCPISLASTAGLSASPEELAE